MKNALLTITALALTGLVGAAVPSLAAAQSSGSIKSMEAGYANGRAMESQGFNPSTRDANGNRMITDGLIQSGVGGSALNTNSTQALTGAAYFQSGASTATASAVGNQVNISVQGSWNTVVLNSTQINNGAVTATTVLNGTTVTSGEAPKP